MSMDLLQEKIRKLKCPLIMDLAVKQEHIPAHICGDRSQLESYTIFCL